MLREGVFWRSRCVCRRISGGDRRCEGNPPCTPSVSLFVFPAFSPLLLPSRSSFSLSLLICLSHSLWSLHFHVPLSLLCLCLSTLKGNAPFLCFLSYTPAFLVFKRHTRNVVLVKWWFCPSPFSKCQTGHPTLQQ